MVATPWNVEMVKGREAQDLLPRDPNNPDAIDWGDVEVAQIDTGCTQHEAFGPWTNNQSPVLNVDDGVNLCERGHPPFDPLNYDGTAGHGTRIQSVICARLPGTYFGVAPGVPTIPYRAINHVVITSKSARKRIAEAIRHAVDINACEVISLSVGTPLLSLFGQRQMGSAVDYAYKNGVIVVGAGGQIIDRVTYPGKFSRTIGVGGVSEDRSVWFEYEQGMARRSIDIWAPADDIHRANSKLGNGNSLIGNYGVGDGTSYATAHVACAAAMWLTFHRNTLDNAYPKPWQRIEAFRRLLAETSTDVAGDYWPDTSKGILNIEALLNAALPAKSDLVRERRKAEDEIF